MTEPADFTITKRCDLCDTPLEMRAPDGTNHSFVSHDAQFCRVLTLHRIQVLERVLADAQARANIAHHERCNQAVRSSVLRDALGEALDYAESAYEDQRCSSQPKTDPDLDRLREVWK